MDPGTIDRDSLYMKARQIAKKVSQKKEAIESKQDSFPQGIVNILFNMKKCVFLQDIFKL
jgi:hypothetical protein